MAAVEFNFLIGHAISFMTKTDSGTLLWLLITIVVLFLVRELHSTLTPTETHFSQIHCPLCQSCGPQRYNPFTEKSAFTKLSCKTEKLTPQPKCELNSPQQDPIPLTLPSAKVELPYFDFVI